MQVLPNTVCFYVLRRRIMVEVMFGRVHENRALRLVEHRTAVVNLYVVLDRTNLQRVSCTYLLYTNNAVDAHSVITSQRLGGPAVYLAFLNSSNTYVPGIYYVTNEKLSTLHAINMICIFLYNY